MTVESKQVLTIAEVIVRHHADVYGYAYRLCGAAADAEDLTQQVFLTAHQKLHQLRSAASVRAWLYTVLRNSYWKSLQKRRIISAVDADFDINECPDGSSRDDVDSDFDQEQLQQALDRLSPEFQIVITMFYFEELSYREIAAALELPEGTVMSRLSRAKGHLRKLLSAPQVSDSRSR